MFSQKHLVTGTVIALIANAAIQSLVTVRADRYGYYQIDCPSIVRKAIETVSAECNHAARNMLCYGNNTLKVDFQSGAPVTSFQQPGDLVNVSQIKQLTLSGLDTSSDTWGVAEMKIKADLPDTDPLLNVTMILFGDVQLSDAAVDANATAIARTPFHQTPTPTTAPAVSPSGSAGGPYQGLQAFYFQANDEPGCDQAPHDGILIQSPQGKQRVTLVIDGATISLGSTVFVQAQAGKFLTVNTLEGSAQVTVGGFAQTAEPGSAVQVPLDTNLRPTGPPLVPEFYTSDTIRALPIAPLPTVIAPVPGFPTNPVTTHWTSTSSGGAARCVSIPSETGMATINSGNASNYLWFTDHWILGQTPRHNNVLLARSSDGSYHGTYQDTLIRTSNGQPFGTQADQFTFRFTDPLHMVGQKTIAATLFTGQKCTVNIQIRLTETDNTPLIVTPTAGQ